MSDKQSEQIRTPDDNAKALGTMSDMWTTTETIHYELPDWMRQARRGVDWGVLFVIVLSLIAAWPFILNSNLPHTNASENYVYRTADFATALQEGRLYPRWSPNALGGYGAPIPNYYPPGAVYAAAVVDALLTNDPVAAVRVIYVLALCLAGTSVYVFVTRRTSASVGILAALLYVYSPYVGLVAPHVLGDLPGVVSLALIPALLWAIDRILHMNRPMDVAYIAFITAALILTNQPAAAVGGILALIFIVWHRWFQGGKVPIRLVVISLALGVSLACFYWLPAWLEQGLIRWQANPISADLYRLTFTGLFAPLQLLDPNEMLPSAQLTVGLFGWLFVMAGAAACIRFGKRIAFQGLFLFVGIGLLVVTLLVFPTETWLLGPVMLCLSIGGSAGLSFGDHLSRRRRRLILPVLTVFIWIGSSAIWFAPQYTELFGSTDAETQVQYEQQGYGIAVLPPGESIPSTFPIGGAPDNRSLAVSFQADPVNKIAPGQISINFQASPLSHFTHSDHILIQRSAVARPLEIMTAYFPGWYATLADHPIPLTRSGDGLIQVDMPILPTSSNELVVALGATDVRTASWIIASMILLIIIVITVGRVHRSEAAFEEMVLLSRSETRLMFVPVACFAAITLAFSYGNLPISLLAQNNYLLRNSVDVNTRTDAGLSLAAFQADMTVYHPGDVFGLTLYWQAQRILSDNYQVKLSLVNNRDGSVWDETGFRSPGFYPTRRWNTRQYVADQYALKLPNSIEPGNYQIRVEVSDCTPDCSTGNRLTFFDATGENQGAILILPTLIAVSS